MTIRELTEQKWDLIVVGGGLTGVAAAAAAKRGGVESVLLVDKAGYLGGAAAINLIMPFMPYSTTVDGKHFPLSRGLFTELTGLLTDIGALCPDGHNGIQEELLKIALDRFVVREGIEVLLHAYLCGAEKTGDSVTALNFATKTGVLRLKAKYFIDCTGDADLAVAAGCPTHLGREDHLCQPMTLCFRIGNVDIRKLAGRFGDVQKKYKELQAEGKIKNPREDILVFLTDIEGVLHFNTTRVVRRNPMDPLDVTKAEMEAREQMLEMYLFLKQYAPGCENCSLLYSGSEIGVRESRMIEGEYVLTQEDLVACRVFEDAIAAGNYDIDIHNPEGSGTSHYYFPQGSWYTIPFRSLIPKGTDNLLVAGRCISSTHEAQASYRIMPIVTTLGEAAGTAMAVAWNAGVKIREADIHTIQNILRKNGAFIGKTETN